MKPSENLIAARDYLLEHGWTRNHMEDSQGRVCALGALEAVDVDADEAFEADCLERAVREIEPDYEATLSQWCVVSHFNDITASESDIHAIYDRAILIAKEAES